MLKLTSSHLATIVQGLSEELVVDVCSLYIATADSHLELAATYGLSQSVIGARMGFNQGLTGRVARSRHSLSVKNPHTHPDYYHLSSSGEEKYNSYLGIPLIREEQIFGVLVVQTVRSKMFFMSEIKALYNAGERVMDILSGDTEKPGSTRYLYQKLA